MDLDELDKLDPPVVHDASSKETNSISELRNEISELRKEMESRLEAALAEFKSREPTQPLQTHSDDEIARVKKEVERLEKGLQNQVEEQTKRAKELQKDIRDIITPMKEELHKLTAFTAGALDKLKYSVTAEQQQELEDRFDTDIKAVKEEVERLGKHQLDLELIKFKELPNELETIWRYVRALQEQFTAWDVKSTMTSNLETPREHEELARHITSVKQDLLKTKDVFKTGEAAAQQVMSEIGLLQKNVEDLRTTLKDRHPSLGEDPVQQLRSSLRQELGSVRQEVEDELKSLKSLIEMLLPSKEDS